MHKKKYNISRKNWKNNGKHSATGNQKKTEKFHDQEVKEILKCKLTGRSVNSQ